MRWRRPAAPAPAAATGLRAGRRRRAKVERQGHDRPGELHHPTPGSRHRQLPVREEQLGPRQANSGASPTCGIERLQQAGLHPCLRHRHRVRLADCQHSGRYRPVHGAAAAAALGGAALWPVQHPAAVPGQQHLCGGGSRGQQARQLGTQSAQQEWEGILARCEARRQGWALTRGRHRHHAGCGALCGEQGGHDGGGHIHSHVLPAAGDREGTQPEPAKASPTAAAGGPPWV